MFNFVREYFKPTPRPVTLSYAETQLIVHALRNSASAPPKCFETRECARVRKMKEARLANAIELRRAGA